MALTEEQKQTLLEDPRFQNLINKRKETPDAGPTTVDVLEREAQVESARQRRAARLETVAKEEIKNEQDELKKKSQELESRPGFVSRAGEATGEVVSNLGERLLNEAPNETPVETAFDIVGTGAEVIGKIGKEAWTSLYRKLPNTTEIKIQENIGQAAKDLRESAIGEMMTPVVKGASNELQEFKEKHPRIAKNFGNIFKMGEAMMSVVGAKFAKDLTKEGIELVSKAGKDLVKSGGEKIAKAKIAGQVEKIGEKIAPKLTIAEKRIALAEGRVTKGKTGFFGKKAPDKVELSKDNIKSANTIQKEIPNASKMDSDELAKEIKFDIAKKSDELRPSLQSTPVTDDTAGKIIDTWDELKKSQTASANFDQFPGAKKLQDRFENTIEDALNSKNLEELWDARVEYDKVVRAGIKNADDLKDPWTIYQKERWLENRNILNQAIKEASSELDVNVAEAFETMSDLYNGRTNIIMRADVDANGNPGIIRRNLGKIIGGAATGAGIKTFLD